VAQPENLNDYMVHHLILVVGDLELSEQKFIYKMLSLYQDYKSIYVIHNFANLTQTEQVEKKINSNIKTIFQAEEKIHMNMQLFLQNPIAKNSEEKSGERILHLVLAREGSPAGNKYNETTINFLFDKFRVFPGGRTINIFDKFSDYCAKSITNYIKLASEKPIYFSLKFDEKDRDQTDKLWYGISETMEFTASNSRYSPPHRVVKTPEHVIVYVELGYYNPNAVKMWINVQSDGHFLTLQCSKTTEDMMKTILDKKESMPTGYEPGNIEYDVKYYLKTKIAEKNGDFVQRGAAIV